MAMAMSVPIASTVSAEESCRTFRALIARTPAARGGSRGRSARRYGLRADDDRLEALGVELRSDRAGAVDFLLLGEEERRRSHLEDVHELGGNPVEQLHHVAGLAAPERICKASRYRARARKHRGLLTALVERRLARTATTRNAIKAIQF